MLTVGQLFRRSFYSGGAQMRKFFITFALLASVAGGALAGTQVGYASITHEMRLYRSLSSGVYEFGGLLGGLADTLIAATVLVNFAVFYLTTYKSGPVWLEVACAACTGFAALVALPFQPSARTQADSA